jgi:hypothetical protein
MGRAWQEILSPQVRCEKKLQKFFARIFTGVLPVFVASAAGNLKFSSSLFFILASVQRMLKAVGEFCEGRDAYGAFSTAPVDTKARVIAGRTKDTLSISSEKSSSLRVSKRGMTVSRFFANVGRRRWGTLAANFFFASFCPVTLLLRFKPA